MSHVLQASVLLTVITIRARRKVADEDLDLPVGVAKLGESKVVATAGIEKEDDSIVSDGPVVAEVAPVSVSGDRGDFSPAYDVDDGPSSLRFLGSTETYDVCILYE